ncbi:hypothetical protein BD769DRAFT_1393930 [Suillus cothurnatus]|nr:hypothetical protein BD769DRAFT_1393930 [Suillus cothurnatus]
MDFDADHDVPGFICKCLWPCDRRSKIERSTDASQSGYQKQKLSPPRGTKPRKRASIWECFKLARFIDRTFTYTDEHDANWGRGKEKERYQKERFSSYYEAQHVIPDEEWDQFIEASRRPLPTTFCIAGSREIAQALNDDIKRTHVPLLSDVVPPPRRSIRLARQIQSKTTLALLVRRPGISSGAPTVIRTINTTFRTWDTYNETLTEEQRADRKMSETHWPPINAQSLPLHHW